MSNQLFINTCNILPNMNKTIIFILTALIAFTYANAQALYLTEGGKFFPNKITVGKITPDTVYLKVHHTSSERCACESAESFEAVKNEAGEYTVDLYDGYVKVNVIAGKATSVNVYGPIDYECCMVSTGDYIAKPAPPAGSKTPGKLTKVNAAPEDFLTFWKTFQSKMKDKDSIIPHIYFPYAISCNYLDNSYVTANEFSNEGTEIYVNGNAFIANTFSPEFYPDLKGLFVGPYKPNRYMDTNLAEKLNEFHGNLDNIIVVSELGKDQEQVGYKAYFKKTNGSYKFIGFEGFSEGD
jgi:hypothetical protein